MLNNSENRVLAKYDRPKYYPELKSVKAISQLINELEPGKNRTYTVYRSI